MVSMGLVVKGFDGRMKAVVRRLEVPRARLIRWARTQRWYIKPEFRCIFDVEADPEWRGRGLGEKVEEANRRRGGGYEITERDYLGYLEWERRHYNVMLAKNVLALNIIFDFNVVDDLLKARQLAVERGDVGGILSFYRSIMRMNKDLAEMLGLDQPKPQKESKLKVIEVKDDVIDIE